MQRLTEGSGEAMYEIGVADNGQLIGLSSQDMNASLVTLKKMGTALRADMSIVRQRTVSNGKVIAEVMFRKGLLDEQHFLEIRVAILGGYDAGKSTLLGVLTHSETDNGRGKSRLNLLRHRHEIETGRTSSISHQIVGFDAQGELINYASTNITSWEQICEQAAKIVTFMDLCGHPKYQKTTMSGITGTAPDYSCLIISGNAGDLSEISRDHLAISVILKMPVFIVITKIDITNTDSLTCTIHSLLKVLQSPGICKMPLVIQNEDDVVASTSDFMSSRIIPIFLVSSVSGENLPLLTKFLNILPRPRGDFEKLADEETEFQIDEVYSVPDVGFVVGGVMKAGRIHMSSGQPFPCYLGPDRGRYIPVLVHSIHHQRCPVKHIQAGQVSTCAIFFPPSANQTPEASTQTSSKLSRDLAQLPKEMTHSHTSLASLQPTDWANSPPLTFRLRRGQVLVTAPSRDALPLCFWEFEADMHVLYHTSMLVVGAQGTIHCGSLRQTVVILSITPEETTSSGTRSSQPVSKSPPVSYESEKEPSHVVPSLPIDVPTKKPIDSPATIVNRHSAPSSSSLGLHAPTSSPRKRKQTNVISCESSECLMIGQSGKIRFRFLHEPEFLSVGCTVLLRATDRTKCVGKIVSTGSE